MKSNEINEGSLLAALSSVGLTEEQIKAVVYSQTDSTNMRAREYAENCDTDMPVLFVADSQSDGRGRLGRSFLSPGGAGIYMSLLVFPRLHAKDAVRITAYTAVAVSRAIEAVTPLKPKIKWVNDVYVGERKLAGILVEGNVSPDGMLKYAIIGIGINTHANEREGLDRIATDIESECGVRACRATLAARVAGEILSGIDGMLDVSISDEYRERSMLIGRSVRVIKQAEEYEATVTGITDSCELQIVRDGKQELLSTGEVSLRL